MPRQHVENTKEIWSENEAKKANKHANKRIIYWPPLWNKASKFLSYPSYPGWGSVPYISLQNLTNCLHKRQKVASARRMTSLAGSPPFDSRVPFLAEPTFLYINTSARPPGSSRSRRDDQSMRERCCHWKDSSWLGQRCQLFFSCKRSLKLTRHFLCRVGQDVGKTFMLFMGTFSGCLLFRTS